MADEKKRVADSVPHIPLDEIETTRGTAVPTQEEIETLFRVLNEHPTYGGALGDDYRVRTYTERNPFNKPGTLYGYQGYLKKSGVPVVGVGIGDAHAKRGYKTRDAAEWAKTVHHEYGHARDYQINPKSRGGHRASWRKAVNQTLPPRGTAAHKGPDRFEWVGDDGDVHYEGDGHDHSVPVLYENNGREEIPMATKFDPKKWVRDHEGFRDEVYLDTRGLPTVGVGHLITETSPYYGAQVGDIISPTQLEEQYNKDYEHHAELAAKNFKNFEKHPPHVQESLINMTFQMGNKPSKWKNFNKALEEGLETGNYQNAAYHAADSKWFREQTPKRARSVLDRLAYGDRSTYSYNRPEEFEQLPDYTVPQYNEGEKKVPWYDKFVPESAKDTARGVKRGYQVYKAIDDYDTWARETPLVPAIPYWQEPTSFETIKEYAKPGLEAAKTYGRLERKLENQYDRLRGWLNLNHGAPIIGEDSYGNPSTHPGSPRGEDTVPAWLTPGEAVLNAEAAEILGRDKIEELNNMGKKVKHYGGGHWQVPNPAPQYANMGMKEAVQYYQSGVPTVEGWDQFLQDTGVVPVPQPVEIVPTHNPPAVPTDFDAAEAQEALVASGQQAPAVPAPAPAYVPLSEASTIPTGVEPVAADTGTLDQSSTGDLLSLVPSEDLSNAHVMDLTGRVDPAAEAELVRRGYVKIGGRWQEGEAKAEETAMEVAAEARQKLETGQVITPEDQQNLNAAQRVREAGAENQAVADEAATIQAAQDQAATQQKLEADREQENKNRIAAGLEPKVFTTAEDGTVTTGDAETDNRVNAGKDAAAEVDDGTWDQLTDKVKGWWGKTMDFLGKEEFEGALSTTVLAYLGSRALGYDSDASWGFARKMGLNLYSQAKQQSAANQKQFAAAQADVGRLSTNHRRRSRHRLLSKLVTASNCLNKKRTSKVSNSLASGVSLVALLLRMSVTLLRTSALPMHRTLRSSELRT